MAMPGCDVTETRLRLVLPFEAAPAEVRLLRRAAVRQLGRWGMPAVAEETELLVTELATNVIKHVGEGATATLILEWCGEVLRLEVHDKSWRRRGSSRRGVRRSAGGGCICWRRWLWTGAR